MKTIMRTIMVSIAHALVVLQKMPITHTIPLSLSAWFFIMAIIATMATLAM
jgi:hypothetical protein